MRQRTIKQEIMANPELWNWQKKKILYGWLIIALCILSIVISVALACWLLALLFVYMTIFLIQNKRLTVRITTEVLEQIDTEGYAVLKEQRNIVKGHPKYRRLCIGTKVNIAFLCFGFIAFLASPPFGLIFLTIGFIWLLFGAIRKSRVKKEVADFLEQGNSADWWNLDNKRYVKLLIKQPSGIKHKANPVQMAHANAKAGIPAEPAAAPNNSGNRQSNRAAEAVVGTAAAYATGKAVGDAVKKTDTYQKMAQNPYSGGRGNNEEIIKGRGVTYVLKTDYFGNQELRTTGGSFLGKYDKRGDKTTDRSGRLVGRGNCLRSLMK